jgi:predicted Zn-dependent peptidase
MSLRDWLKNGWVVEHASSADEISDLIYVADRDLKDAQTPGLSPDWRLNIAYSAALQMATAALAAGGYRASRESHHYRVIQSLAYTIEADSELINQFDQFRKKRNISGYERAGTVSEHEAQQMFELAVEIRKRVEEWIRRNYADLIQG